MSLLNDDKRVCVGIVILEDDVVEEDESFQVIVEGLDISATVTILDDDGIGFGSCCFFSSFFNFCRCVSKLHWEFSCCPWQHYIL